MAKYDVFISCKSEDYKYAEEVYDFLNEHGINTFLASKELRRLGESEYRRAISKALREAYHLIVFASNPEYIESTWVEYEWDMFVNAKLKGKKAGNILTILKGVDTDDIPMDLWKYESFPFEDYHNNLLQYVETPESIARNKEKELQKEDALRKKREAEAKAARVKELKAKLTNTAEEYKKSVSALQVDVDKINSLLEELEITHRECPICHASNPVDANVCATCGWPISPLEGLPDLAYLSSDADDSQSIYSGIYSEYLKLKQRSVAPLTEQKKIVELEATIKQLKDEILKLKNRPEVAPQSANATSQRVKETPKRAIETPEIKSGYSVWVTFCPIRAEKIVENYQRDFDPQKLRIFMGAKCPYLVTKFSTYTEAKVLEERLEGQGATVKIQKFEVNDSVGNSSDNSAHTTSTQAKAKLNQTARIQINSCGRDIGEVAQLLTLYFGRSKNSFKSILQTLPYTTPHGLTLSRAQELSSKLRALGVSSVLITD